MGMIRKIAVWGNSGSGKSTLAIKLALNFVAKKLNTILIDTDFVAPQTNVWYPKMEIGINSMAKLLDNTVNTENVASKIQVINKYFGILGYAKDFSTNSVPGREDTVHDLMEILPTLCEVSVIDCQTAVTNDMLTMEALSSCDAIIVAITPDVKGLSWYDCNIRAIEDSWKQSGRLVIKLFNKVAPASPADEVENITGTVQYYLPYSSDIEEELYTGQLGSIEYRKKAKKYAKVLDSITDAILSNEN